MSVDGGQLNLTWDRLSTVALNVAGVAGAWASAAVVTAKSPLMVPMVSVARVVVPGVGAEVTRTVTVSLGLMVPVEEVYAAELTEYWPPWIDIVAVVPTVATLSAFDVTEAFNVLPA